jgi:cobalamin biosynthesis protein CobD/CbiB
MTHNERKQKRIALGTIFTIATVIVASTVGWIISTVQPPHSQFLSFTFACEAASAATDTAESHYRVAMTCFRHAENRNVTIPLEQEIFTLEIQKAMAHIMAAHYLSTIN